MNKFNKGDRFFLIPNDNNDDYMIADHLEITSMKHWDDGNITYRFGPIISPPLMTTYRVYPRREEDLIEFLDSVTYEKYNKEVEIKIINKSIESKKQELDSNIKDIELLELAKSKNHEIIDYLELSIASLKDNIDAVKHVISYDERKLKELLTFNEKLKEFVKELNN